MSCTSLANSRPSSRFVPTRTGTRVNRPSRIATAGFFGTMASVCTGPHDPGPLMPALNDAARDSRQAGSAFKQAI